MCLGSSRRFRRRPDSRLPRVASVSVLLLVLFAFALAIAPAVGASRRWCRSDPVITVEGQVADIFVSARLDDLTSVTGPTQIVVEIPVGIDARLIARGVGFGYGEEVTFVESRNLRASKRGIDLRIEVLVPASDDDMPVLVEFAPRLVGVLAPVGAEGTANDWIRLRVNF
jgi:hypothetical protein